MAPHNTEPTGLIRHLFSLILLATSRT